MLIVDRSAHEALNPLEIVGFNLTLEMLIVDRSLKPHHRAN